MSLFFILFFGTSAWGQYSSADCTGPQVIGTDSFEAGIRTCTNGILFTANDIPSGTFHAFLVETRPATAPNDPYFHFTSPGLSLHAFMSTEGQLRSFNPIPENRIYVYSTSGLGDGFACDPNETSLPIRGCPTDYGMFFDIDSDGNGSFDDMEVAFIDGTAVPLNFRILFVPLNWGGTQAQFDAQAQAQVNSFTNATALAACVNTVEVVTLDVNTQNFNTYTCTTNDARFGSVRQFLRNIDLGVTSFDVIVGMFPSGGGPACGWGGITNTIDMTLLDPIGPTRMTHEIGHFYNLSDEYCAEEAGGDPRCAGPSDINFLGADLGCDPTAGGGCCICSNAGAPMGTPACAAACDPGAPANNYHICCNGNLGSTGGNRCIMSTDPGRQSFCQRCLNRLNGRTEFGCDALPTTPFQDILAIDLSLSDAEGATLNAVELDKGRPTRIDIPGNRFRVKLDAPSGNLLNEEFNVVHYDVDVPQVVTDFYYKVPVDFSLDAPPPIVLTVQDSGKDIIRGTLFGNPPVANPGDDVNVECTSLSGTEVTLDGSASSDEDGDMLHFHWSAPGIEFDDPTSETPTAQFPVGNTSVTLVVSDGVSESSDAVIVRVVDTTAPVITLNGPSEMTLECHVDIYTEMGAIVSDRCDTELTTPTIGGDTVDVNTPGTYTITYNAVDASGNAATQVTRIVTVVDTLPPTLTAPSDIVAECTSPPGVSPDLGTPTVSDICDASPIVTNDAPALFLPGVTTVTWTAIDVGGNVDTDTQMVTVLAADLVIPTFQGRGVVFPKSVKAFLQWQVANQGDVASDATTVEFWLSNNTTLDGGDILLSSEPVPALATSASTPMVPALATSASTPIQRTRLMEQLNVRIDTSLTWYIIIVVDRNNAICESNDNNNEAPLQLITN